MANGQDLVLSAGEASYDPSAGSIFFIGTATVLIRCCGITILTDPNFIHAHEQVSIGYGLHATRLTDPAIEVGALPPLDLIVLSHFHGDHFDQVAERELDKSLPIVTTAEAADELRERGFHQTYSLETWSALNIRKRDVRLRITSMPGRHGPPLSDFVLPEVMGSMLEFDSATGNSQFRMYITGDTLLIDDLKEIPRRFPGINLALLHLGGTKVLGIMVTMDGRQGVELMQIVNAEQAIPIHYDDYDVFKSPLSDFQREIAAAGLDERVRYLERGQEYTFSLAPAQSAALPIEGQLR
jgi:L-ascorbate metabolism protein UlaG (beta-lactamase superfamily)